MKILATAVAAALAAGVLATGSSAIAAEQGKRDDPQAEAPAPKTPAEMRAEIYARLAVSADADETEGLVALLFASYGQSGSDTGDLLIQRARKAIAGEDYGTAARILDAAVAFMPDKAEAWNARATLRFLDDDYDGSMADIAETLKREPRHLGALMGMAKILASQDKKKQALEVYQRALALAPHWKMVEEAADKLKAEAAGQEL